MKCNRIYTILRITFYDHYHQLIFDYLDLSHIWYTMAYTY